MVVQNVLDRSVLATLLGSEKPRTSEVKGPLAYSRRPRLRNRDNRRTKLLQCDFMCVLARVGAR